MKEPENIAINTIQNEHRGNGKNKKKHYNELNIYASRILEGKEK